MARKRKKLKILHKLLLGYAVFLVIAIFFGVYVHNNITHIRVKQRLVEVAEDARDEVLEMRRNEKNFIIRRDPEYIKNIHTINTSLIKSVTNLEPDIVSVFGEEDYTSLRDSLESYAAEIDLFSQNYEAEAALSERFRSAGRQLEDAVLKLNDPGATRGVFEIRLLEKNYVLFKNIEYIDRLKENVGLLKAGMKSKEVQISCDAYIATGEKLVKSGGREAMLLGRIQDTAKQIQDIIEKVAKRERAEIDEYLISSQRLLLFALFALASVGPLLMLYVAKAITSPIIKLEEAARKISEGDEDIRVKVRGDFETASLQRSFNVMLNKLQTSRESLEDSIRLLQEKNAMLVESEKLASIGVLASGVAHEINNPLANIMLTAETVREEGRALPEEELDVLIKDVVEQTERAQGVVNNLLSYTRAMREEKLEEVDLRDSVKRAIRLLAHQVQLQDTDIKEDYSGSPLMVSANMGRLEQVFVNIIMNALHAMGKGGAISVSVKPDRGNNLAVAEIKDTGPGIPQEHLQKIFDPFFTTKPVGQGTGLGLYISYGIVKDHGGDIEVESSPGKGALFRVRLPLVNA